MDRPAAKPEREFCNVKHGTENKLKFKKLQRRLDLSLWQAKGLLQTLWDFARGNAPAGDVGKYEDDELAIGIDWRGDPQDLISALIDNGWLDRIDGPGRLIIHDWWEHCEDSIHMQLARHRKLFADGQRPKLTRIERGEREQIIADYERLCANGATAGSPPSHAERTETHAEHTTLPDLTLPYQNPALPDPATPAPAGAPANAQVSGACADEGSGTKNGRQPSVFEGVTVATLKDPARLDAWWRMASKQKPKPVISGSEQDRLRIHGAAERALDPESKARSAKAMFVDIVTVPRWERINAKQDDRARARIKELDRAARDGP